MARDHDGGNNPDFHAFKEIASSRRSYKEEFEGEPVDPLVITKLIDVARWAPSAHNAQPWRFVVFFKQDPAHHEARIAMIEAMASHYHADLVKDGHQDPAALDAANSSVNRFSEAPVLLLACADSSVMDKYSDGARREAEHVMATQSVAAAIQTFLIAAHAARLGACWYCAPLFAQDIIKVAINLHQAWIPQAFITVGYRKEEGTRNGGSLVHPLSKRAPSSTRRKVGEILFTPDRLK